MVFTLIPQAEDVLERDPRTITQWQEALGTKSQQFHFWLCTVIGLTLNFLQMDELWSYLKRKLQQLWVFVGFEADTKFWLHFELGSRTTHTATRLLKQLTLFISSHTDCLVRVATDKLSAYSASGTEPVAETSL